MRIRDAKVGSSIPPSGTSRNKQLASVTSRGFLLSANPAGWPETLRRRFCSVGSHLCVTGVPAAAEVWPHKVLYIRTVFRYSCSSCSEFDQSIPIEEQVIMNRIQKLFEQIAGVYQAETHRWAIAQEVFTAPRVDVSALQKPACWRRKSRIYGARR
ncbi:hypothetical protein [Accumulibacter sp.]|nr:hypothetical protein [Accumulibacter sp.]HRF03496.1 hypothetical protein [Accumulibacter sp.]